jgi:hypothetical protein
MILHAMFFLSVCRNLASIGRQAIRLLLPLKFDPMREFCIREKIIFGGKFLGNIPILALRLCFAV